MSEIPDFWTTAECIGCGGFLPEGHLVSKRGTALRYCSQECHDSWEDELERREQHQRDRKAFYEWEDGLYV